MTDKKKAAAAARYAELVEKAVALLEKAAELADEHEDLGLDNLEPVVNGLDESVDKANELSYELEGK